MKTREQEEMKVRASAPPSLLGCHDKLIQSDHYGWQGLATCIKSCSPVAATLSVRINFPRNYPVTCISGVLQG
jgi:hypothetical protein